MILPTRSTAMRALAAVATSLVALSARYALNPLLGDRVPWFTSFPAILLGGLMGDVLGAAITLVLAGALGTVLFEPPTAWVTAAYFFSGSIMGASAVALRRALLSLRDLSRASGEGLALLAASEGALREQISELTKLHEFGTQVIGTFDRDTLLTKLLEAATAAQGATRGFIELLDPSSQRLVPGTSIGHDEQLFDLLARVAVGEGQGACGTCAFRRARVIVEDTEADPIFAAFRDKARQAGFRAVWSTPLLTRKGDLVGVLSTHFNQPHRPTQREIQLVELYARLAADAIEMATLYAHADQARRDAERALAAVRDADRRKDEFLAMLAHELRNPLAPIRLILEIARRHRQAGLTEKQLATLDRQTATLARLVEDLLDVARVTQGKIDLRRELLSVGALVSRAVDAVQQLMDDRRHQLVVSLPPEPLAVQGDPVRLEQVLVNVLSNAAKYTPKGGHVSLTARAHGGRVEIRVKDDGEGIETGELERIFELFAQVKQGPDRAKGGLGLGLKIVRSLVEMHSGTVRAKSEGPGRGSEFVIELPAEAAPPVASSVAPEQAAPDQAAGRLRVLIVDDNEDAADSLREFVEQLGHACCVVYTGPEALGAARRFAPDLVLLDIGLPEMDGYEVARRLQAEGITQAPLVAITGYGQSADRARALEAGFAYHLVKPVSVDMLSNIIGAIDAARQPEPAAARAS